MADVLLDGRSLTLDQVQAVAAEGASVKLAPSARDAMEASVQYLATEGDIHVLRSKWRWLVGEAAPPLDAATAVRVFVEGHCAGVGEPLAHDEVRALMLARANVLAAGWSGVRPCVVDHLVELLAREWTPEVPSLGAVGAAGSAQLAHLARAAFGLGGWLWVDGRRVEAAAQLAQLPSIELKEKEALSLLNGSSLTTALAALACTRAARLLAAAEAACALTMEVTQADLRCLSERSMQVRGHPGIHAVAAGLRARVEGSELVHERRAPDSFSIRCAPTVLGAAHDALDHVRLVVTRELNGAGDNPLVFPGRGIVEAGHFHAAPVAMAMDHLKVALTQVASISERRIFRLTYGQLSGLPSFLLAHSGANSGLMLAQYTAASLVSEAKARSMPASVDSIPTVQHHEDHVSMGPVAARGALEVVELLADVVAIELLAGAQGLDFRLSGEAVDASGELVSVPPRQPGTGSRQVFDLVRERVSRWQDDRILHPDIAVLGEAVRDGVFSD